LDKPWVRTRTRPPDDPLYFVLLVAVSVLGIVAPFDFAL
jgi:hypothetical protein